MRSLITSSTPDTIARGPAAQRALAYWTKRRGPVPMPSAARSAPLPPSVRAAFGDLLIHGLRQHPHLRHGGCPFAVGDAVSFEHETDAGTLERHDGVITGLDPLTARYCVQSTTDRAVCLYLSPRRLWPRPYARAPEAPSAFRPGMGVWFAEFTKPNAPAEWRRGEIISFDRLTRRYHVYWIDSRASDRGCSVVRPVHEVLPRYVGELAPGVPGPGGAA